jgi:hypothetical protein
MSTHCCFRTGEVKLSASTPVQWLLDDNTVIGVMDNKHEKEPFFLKLSRDNRI